MPEHLVNETVFSKRSVYPVGRLIAFAVLLLVPLGMSVVAQVNDVVPRLQHAAALIADKNLSEAEKELSIVLQAVPNEPAALNLLGTIRAQQRRFNDAEKLFSRAIRGDNRFIGAHLNLAYLYTLTAQPDITIAELTEQMS